MKRLAGMQTLENVTLHSAKLTDATLTTLAGWKNLRTLEVRGSKFSEAAKQQLQEKLPDAVMKW